MSINQPRPEHSLGQAWPEKVANNWDVICLADEFQTGFSDYKRFIRKHKQLYGVGDDGAIEKGPGHVHPAFMDAEPMGIHEGMMFNDEMLKRSKMRAKHVTYGVSDSRSMPNQKMPWNLSKRRVVQVWFPNRVFHGAMRRSAAMSEAIVGALIQTKQPPAAAAAGGRSGGVDSHLANCSPEEATLSRSASRRCSRLWINRGM